MAGPKSKQTIEIERLEAVLNDLLFYAKPLTERHIRWKDGTISYDGCISADVILSFRAAFHRAEKVIKPVKV
jgi:hypothetical protein